MAVPQSAQRARVEPNRPAARAAFTSRTFLPLVILLAAGAFALRIHAIDRESLWLDEGYTLLFSHLPLGKLITVGGAHEHPPLYYLVLHALYAVHDSYLLPRLLSAVAGALAVLATAALGRRLFGAATGLLAGALVTISPFQVWYSRDGRDYAVAGLFVVLSYLTGFVALDERKRRWWALYSVCTALALYSDYMTALALLPQALFAIRAGPAGRLRPLLVAWGGVLLLFLPWIWTLTVDVATIAGNYWIPAPTPRAVANTILEFAGFLTPCPSPPCTGTEVGLPLLRGHEEILAAVIALAVLAIAGYAWRNRLLPVGSLAAWLLVPFVVILVLAPVRSLYLDRVFLDVTFPLYLLLAAGAVRARLPGLRAIALALFLAVAAVSCLQLRPIYAGGINPDWRTTFRDLRSAYRPGQSIIFNPGVLRSIATAYLPPGWHATRERPLWSRAYLDVPGWEKRYPTTLNPSLEERAREEARLRDVQFGEAARGAPAIWLVTFDYPGMNDSRRWFTDRGYTLLLSEIYTGDTRLELWSRHGPASLGSRVPLGNPWSARGRVSTTSRGVVLSGAAAASAPFTVVPGAPYSVAVQRRADPPAYATIAVDVLDRSGRLLGTYPRTEWYDWPASGVWLSQPFGFIAPPGARRAILRLQSSWGRAAWRDIAVYREH